MDKMPKVSLILPAYNAEKYLKYTLESLTNQTLKEIEIIAINDGSKDKTLEILKEFEKKNSKVKIIDKKNEGVWKARMDGIQKASGEYITFIDADDYIEPDFTKELYKSITQNKADMAICGFKRVDGKTGKILSQEMKYDKNRVIEKNNNFEEVIAINTALWNKLYKTSLLKQIKDLEKPPRILEDMMFLTLVYQKINKISFVDQYLYQYIVRDGSAMNVLKKEEIQSIQKAMLEIKKQYEIEKENKEKMEILASMAFLHFRNFTYAKSIRK